MKRLNGIERAGLMLALLFVVVGAYSVIHPWEGLVLHPGSGHYVDRGPRGPESVTKNRARVYGLAMLVVGLGMGWLAVYRPRK